MLKSPGQDFHPEPQMRSRARWLWRATLSVAVLIGCVLSVWTPPSTGNTSTRAFATPEALASRAPNVVVIMADDMRHDELRWMPTTRRLIADRGVTFTNSFAPTRCAAPPALPS